MIDHQEPTGTDLTARFIRALRRCKPTSIIGRDGFDLPYLERTLLWEGFLGSVTVHRFRRNDADVPHDHSFDFLTFILRGAYREERYEWKDGVLIVKGDHLLKAGQVAFRSARTIHRVHVDGGEAWTLVLRGPKRRAWSFWTESGPVLWWEYLNLPEPGPNATKRWLNGVGRKIRLGERP